MVASDRPGGLLKLRFIKYFITLLIITPTTLVTWILYPYMEMTPFILYYPAIIVSTRFGDGTFAIFLSSILAQILFIHPESHYLRWPADYIRQSLFLFGAFMARGITKSLMLTHKDLKLQSDAIENSLSGFDIINEEGKFIYVNQSYLRMWGYADKEEVLGTSPSGHCADPNTPQKIIQRLKETGVCDIELKAKRKDGSTFEVRMLARLAHDADGREVYPTSSVDITEKKKAEEALSEAIRVRDEFLSVASHELKTPLTTLILQSQYRKKKLAKENDGIPTKQDFERMLDTELKQLMRMNRLIDDMLDVSRLRTGKLRLAKERIDLCRLIAEAVERMKHQYEELSIPLTLSPCTPAWIFADPTRIEQVMTNLLTNALKYGGGKPVHCSLSQNKTHAVISVTDHGPGIPTEDQARIFSRFERAVDANQVSGLGLGLAIARDIVEAHGGMISVKSKSGYGSTFEVILPLEVTSP